jgi:7-carboxy-7-deazaguanine synthase
MVEAPVVEVFSSIQGEGPWIGQRHIFVRFAGCDIACRYCDTSAAASGQARASSCHAQKNASSFEFEELPGTLTPGQLTLLCSRLIVPGPCKPVISITGGEPLLHHPFLSAWLPEVKKNYAVYLETNGIHDEAMNSLREMIDIVSMDLKLPSATGLEAFWNEHARFLAASRGTMLFGKAVVTMDTNEEDVLTAARLIAGHDRAVTLVIQPADGPLAPDPELLVQFQNAALAVIADVRIIPQVHKMLKLP